MQNFCYVLLRKPAVKAGFFNARSNEKTSLLMGHFKHIGIALLEEHHFLVSSE
jgi:hypothetical protein